MQVCACSMLCRCRTLHPRCDILHLEPALPARPHHHTYAAGHFRRPQLPVRLAHVHVDRLAGVRCLSSSHNGKSWNFVRRGTPPVKRGVACSMLLSIYRTTHVHVSVRSVRSARGSSGSHGHREPLSMAIVLLLCCGAPSDNFTMHKNVYLSKSDARVRLGRYVRHSPGCATLAASLPTRSRERLGATRPNFTGEHSPGT